ncbi:DUF1345 domain-containing protein [Massilia sp. TSP1-1-2]|uniref:DUF1345 domain-containing protein n=1 Tax=unclassified Massilia TaxID=2609279 RepID=UPI003CE6DDDE
MNPTTLQRKHPKLARIVLARPRLFACMLLGVVAAFAIPATLVTQPITRGILGWNAGALAYLVLTLQMMFFSSRERMRKRAVLHDDGRLLILAMVVLVAIGSLAAIVCELSVAKGLHDGERYWHVGLVVGTLLSSWAFTQVMFATHYAHDFYAAERHGAPGGLNFPDEAAPDYADFLYFACIIGTSGQTADVSFTSRAMRRTGLLHCVLAFFFNATLLSLTINIASGMF